MFQFAKLVNKEVGLLMCVVIVSFNPKKDITMDQHNLFLKKRILRIRLITENGQLTNIFAFVTLVNNAAHFTIVQLVPTFVGAQAQVSCVFKC